MDNTKKQNENFQIGKTIRYYLLCNFLFYCLSFYLFNSGQVETDIFLFQFLCTILSTFFFIIAIKSILNKKIIILFSFVYSVLVYFLLATFGLIETAVDGETYLYAVKRAGNADNVMGSLAEITRFSQGMLNVNDYGYLFLLSSIYGLFGESIGYYILLIVEFIFFATSCALIYDFTEKTFNRSLAKIATSLWMFNPYIAYFASANLKEPIFIFFSVNAMLATVNFVNKCNWKSFTVFILFVSITFLFREVFPLYFILTYLIYKFFEKKVNTTLMIIYIVSCIGFVFLGVQILSLIFEEVTGGIIERQDMYDSQGTSYTILNVINAFISPYAAITKNNMLVNLVTYNYSMINSSFAFFGLMGIWHIIKQNQKQLFPLVMVMLFNSMMLITVGFSMNARYTMMTIYVLYIFIPIGIKYYFKKRYYIPYLAIVLVITYLYNLR